MADKIYELVFHFHTAMSDTLLQLKDLEPHFDTRKQSLRERCNEDPPAERGHTQ